MWYEHLNIFILKSISEKVLYIMFLLFRGWNRWLFSNKQGRNFRGTWGLGETEALSACCNVEPGRNMEAKREKNLLFIEILDFASPFS